MKIALLSLLTVCGALAQQPKFDLAIVRTSTMSPGTTGNFGGVLREGRYVNRDATMLQLIKAAYGVSEDSIAGGPAWVSSDMFDVIAKVPDGTKLPTANLMLQSLLQDRFKLVVHNDTRPAPRYVLSIGKGSKLKPGSESGPAGCQSKPRPPSSEIKSGPGELASQPNIQVACHGLTADAIAEQLHQMAGGYLDHDMLNSTKLEDTWDFDLEWTGRGALEAKGAAGISIFDAVDKQLGLKLELKDVPVPALVVESVNRKPSENPPDVAKTLVFEPARFEAASVKPADPSKPPFMGIIYTGGSQIRAGGTLRSMIAMTMQIPPNVAGEMVIGIPKSADSQHWDINAKVPSTGEGAPNMVGGRPMPPPLSVAFEMLRGVLVDQFELKTHTENREVTVYALTVDGTKSKLIRADDSERTGCRLDPSAPPAVPNVGMIVCKNTTMADLAADLQRRAVSYIEYPVVDATGLQGGWDFAMGWTARSLLQAPPGANSDPASGAIAEPKDPTGGVSVFEAMRRQLGLKLVKQKRSIPVIVVDHFSEKPIE